jgi:hypothetical protein
VIAVSVKAKIMRVELKGGDTIHVEALLNPVKVGAEWAGEPRDFYVKWHPNIKDEEIRKAISPIPQQAF